MRNFLSILFLINVVFVSAQNDSLKHNHFSDSLRKSDYGFYKNTISVSMNGIIQRVVKPNGVPDLNNPFLYYTRNFKKFFKRVTSFLLGAIQHIPKTELISPANEVQL